MQIEIDLDDGLYAVAAYIATQDGRSVESLLIMYLLRDAQQRGLIDPPPLPRWTWRGNKLIPVEQPTKEAFVETLPR